MIYTPVGGDFARARVPFHRLARPLSGGRVCVRPHPGLPFNLALRARPSGRVLGDFAKREPKANAAMMGELAQWVRPGQDQAT